MTARAAGIDGGNRLCAIIMDSTIDQRRDPPMTVITAGFESLPVISFMRLVSPS